MLSVQEQIYGLSQIWSEAKYNFAFWSIREDLDWDRAYEKALSRVMAPMELTDYYLELSRFISLLNDGHTFIVFPEELRREFLTLPVEIRRRGGRFVITNTAQGCQVPPFCEIQKIDGVEFDRYMEERVLPYCWNAKPSSTYEMLYTFRGLEGNGDRNACALIPLLEKNRELELLTSEGSFVIRPIPRTFSWSVEPRLACSEPLSSAAEENGMEIRYTGDGIGVITLRTFMDDEMPQKFYSRLEELSHCRGFVIDVRGNGGGHSDNADAVSQAFLHGEFKTGKVRHPIHIGAYKAWGSGKCLSELDPADPRQKKILDVCSHNLFETEEESACCSECPFTLNQPVVILEDSATGSSAENLLLNFDIAGRAVIVGTPSSGTTGNPLVFKLPGGGMAKICTRRYTYPDNREFINVGVLPHIEAELSLEDLRTGRDSVLDQGLAALRERIKEGDGSVTLTS